MAKVTEYPRITKMKDNDILLVDGPDGTRTILQTDASKQMGGEVIMVNETAGDSTKVVINTTNEDIELATMADLESVEEDVDDLKTHIEEESEGNNKYIPYKNIAETETASKAGTAIIVTEKDPTNFSNLPGGTVIKGRNRFNVDNAVFTFSGYSSANTLTKENNGIKVVNTQTSTSSSVHCYTEYTAEFDGDLYLSCEASVDGNVRDLRMSANLNGEAQEIIWGAGKLFMVIPVAAGDVVRLKFWTHGQTPAGSTVYYKNIMLAYGGLYDFLPYQADIEGEVENVYKTISLADYIESATTHTMGSNYNITVSNMFSDMFAFPATNNDVAQNVSVTPNTFVVSSYYDVYNHRAGEYAVGVNVAGNGVFWIEGKGKGDIRTWLQTNTLEITYKIGETVLSEIDTHQIQSGMIIVLPESGEVSYDYKLENKEKCVCFGDSITGIYNNKANYPEIISLSSDIEAVNVGFSGLTYTDHGTRQEFSLNRLIDAVVANDFTAQNASPLVDPSSSSYAPLYAEHLANLEAVDWLNTRFVTFFYGTNDYSSGAYMTSADDPNTENKQRTNVEDSVAYCISQLLTKYPHLQIIVLTPYWMTFSGTDANSYTNNKGKYLYEYDEAIENAAKNYNVPVINQYHKYGINMITKWYFEKDNAHPTDRLKWIIADNIVNQIHLIR